MHMMFKRKSNFLSKWDNTFFRNQTIDCGVKISMQNGT